jgi:MoaA/NifB/PqqE/SkfB family radical SAM enzyme
MTLRELVKMAALGGPGFLQVAVTNACNAHCRFCSFPKVPPAERFMADPRRLARGLDAASRAGVRYVCITGGEPLLYPDLRFCLDRARALGLETLLVTNGALLTPDLVEDLRRAGFATLIISVDAASEKIHDRHRGIAGLTSHIRKILPVVDEAGIRAVASVTISRLAPDLDAVVRFARELGFLHITFSYPLTRLHSTYLGFAESPLVAFSPVELDRLFAQILKIKDSTAVHILNPRWGLREARRRMQGIPCRFPCLAGYKYFFADWHLNLHRCHFLADTLGPLEEMHRLTPIRDGCNACHIDCYRDPGVYQYIAVSLADTLAAWRRGEVVRGIRSLLNPTNVLSLAALVEGRHWVQ